MQHFPFVKRSVPPFGPLDFRKIPNKYLPVREQFSIHPCRVRFTSHSSSSQHIPSEINKYLGIFTGNNVIFKFGKEYHMVLWLLGVYLTHLILLLTFHSRLSPAFKTLHIQMTQILRPVRFFLRLLARNHFSLVTFH